MIINGILDTSVVIDIYRQVPPAIAWSEFYIANKLGMAITPVVWFEMVQGAVDTPERNRTMRFLRRFTVEHPTPDDNRWAMRQFATFYLGYGVEYTDTMIASVAIRLRVPLYTINVRHYRILPNLEAKKPY